LAGRGRPSTYSEEIAKVICDRLAKGETLKAICRDEDMPADSTVRQWAAEDTCGFYAHYARARNIGLDRMADDLLDICDDNATDVFETNGKFTFNNAAVNRDKLRVDTRKWYLSKLAPKRYGDRLAHELTGADGGPIEVEDKELARRVALMLEKAETSDT